MWRSVLQIFCNPRTLSVCMVLVTKLLKMRMEQEAQAEVAEDVNARKYQPFALPVGSIRALLVLILTGAVIASFFVDAVVLPDGVLELWFGAVGYYVGYRATNNRIVEATV